MHNKIINLAAKSILKPYGIYRKGSSRTWLKDKGYFIIQTEFQPRFGGKGIYLNVGVSFLWEQTEDLNKILPFNFGSRVGNHFVEYNGNDEVFQKEMENLARIALGKVKEYEIFSDLEKAKQLLLKKEDNLFWKLYHLAMLCFFKGDFDEGKTFFEQFLAYSQQDFYRSEVHIKWVEDFYQHCINHLMPQCDTRGNAQQMVAQSIERRRSLLKLKS